MNSKIVLATRLLLGVIFFVFGLNGFLHFLPMPPQPEAAGAFMGALAQTGYMFPLIKGVEVLSGIMLLANLWAPLALILLAPITVNIFFFHAALAPSGLPMGLILIICQLILARSYRERFAPLFIKN
jgi:uncharacterized membrane protein YphA (DoxX/SURF4 family)